MRSDPTGRQALTLAPGSYKGPAAVERVAGGVAKGAEIVAPIVTGAAPYLAGGSLGAGAGARILARSPYLGRLLGSAAGQMGVSAGEDIVQGEIPSLAKAGATGAASLITEGGIGEFGRMAARVSGVPRETVSDVMGMGTTGRARMIYGAPPKGAELAQADIATTRAKEALGKKTIGRRAAERKMAEFDLSAKVPSATEDITQHPLSTEQFHKQYSQTVRAGTLVGETPHGLKLHMPGERFEAKYPNAKVLRKKAIQSALDAGEQVPREILEDFPDILYQQEARVDITPIKQRLSKMIKSEPWRSEEQKSANAILRGKIADLPDQMKIADFDQWITEHTKPIGKKIGAIDQSLPVEARKEIAAFGRQYRNKVIPRAKADFLQASKDLGAYKRFRKQILDIQGDPKISVENIWRRLPQNQELLRTFRRFDEAATRNGIPSNLAEDALYLAKKRDWTSDDIFHAYLILRGAQRFIIRPVLAKPSLVAAPTVGRVAGAATAAFTETMQPRSNP